jgi:hypothetical protein
MLWIRFELITHRLSTYVLCQLGYQSDLMGQEGIEPSMHSRSSKINVRQGYSLVCLLTQILTKVILLPDISQMFR